MLFFSFITSLRPLYAHLQSFFVAHGPSFKQNFTTPPFENVQLYSLFQTLLNLPDRETNATKHRWDKMGLDSSEYCVFCCIILLFGYQCFRTRRRRGHFSPSVA